MTTSINDVPHTGGMGYADSIPKVPGISVSTHDAEILSALLKSEDIVTVTITMSATSLPEVASANVIGQLTGSEYPEEVIVIGGHLDSWDKGVGAHDDGAGCVQSIEALNLLKNLGLKPKRTIRVVMFMNEENGLRGGLAYAARERPAERHIAMIESDMGGFAARGFGVSDSAAYRRIASGRRLVVVVLVALQTIGLDLTVLSVFGGALGVGIGLGLQKLASNYIAGFVILMDRSIRLGDLITVSDRQGVVTNVTSRYCVVRSLDGVEAIVPNETLVTTTVLNHSFSARDVRVAVAIQVAYGTDLERALAVLCQVAREHPRVDTGPPREPEDFVVRFAENGIDLELGFWSDLEKIEAYILANKRVFKKGLAILSSQEKNIWKEFHLSVPIKNEVIVDKTPYIKPLLDILDNYRRYAILLVGRESARLFIIHLGEIEEYTEVHSDDVPGRHKKGGWYALSEKSYERHIDYHVALHLKDVLKQLDSFLSREYVGRLIIGGTEEAVTKVKAMLPQAVTDKIIGTFQAEMFSKSKQILEKVAPILRGFEKKERICWESAKIPSVRRETSFYSEPGSFPKKP